MNRILVTVCFIVCPFSILADEISSMDDMGMHKDKMSMNGFYGQYPMSRESSGTAWIPDSSPMEGIHQIHGDWMTMLHGYVDLIYDDQGGRRGDNKTFSESMLMGMASHPLGGGTIGFRTMLSFDALMGKDGYPLLLQTGETADGKTLLLIASIHMICLRSWLQHTAIL
jgi:hypothetical protein